MNIQQPLSYTATHTLMTLSDKPHYLKALARQIMKTYTIPYKDNQDVETSLLSILNTSSDDVVTFRKCLDYLVDQGYKRRNLEFRSANREEMVTNLLNGMSYPPITRYLDYGCGDGSITQSVASSLNIKPANTFGVDIHDQPTHTNITYLRAGTDEDDPLPTESIPNQSIDLVTAFVVFHHMNNGILDKVLTEIARILKPNGLLVIREHDYNGTRSMYAYLHLVHILWDVVNSYRASDEIAVPVNESTTLASTSADNYFRSMSAWSSLINMYGFVSKKLHRYKGNNPQGLYHYVYQLRPA